MEATNREQRRHPEKVDELRRQAGLPPAEAPTAMPEQAMRGNDRRQDDVNVRARASGHGKKTADKWNQ